MNRARAYFSSKTLDNLKAIRVSIGARNDIDGRLAFDVKIAGQAGRLTFGALLKMADGTVD